MTNSALRTLVALASLLVVPTLASAQPDEGQFAAGGDVGLFLPSDGRLDTGFIWGGFLEGYASRRVGIRGSIFTTAPEVDESSDDALRQIRVGVDVIYNWEGGKIHPFAGAGLGAHFMQFTDDGEDVGDGDTDVGFSLLGGLEYFLNRAWTVKGEVRYQWVDDFGDVEPDGLALTVGLKRYF